jgi:hypothetical protein
LSSNARRIPPRHRDDRVGLGRSRLDRMRILRPTRDATSKKRSTSGSCATTRSSSPARATTRRQYYVRANTPWNDYSAIQIESVSLWIEERVEEAERRGSEEAHRLCSTRRCTTKLRENFKIVDQPGPGVIPDPGGIDRGEGSPGPRFNNGHDGDPAGSVGVVGPGTRHRHRGARGRGEPWKRRRPTRSRTIASPRSSTLVRDQGNHADALEVGRRQAICDHWGERARDFFVRQGVQPEARCEEGEVDAASRSNSSHARRS